MEKIQRINAVDLLFFDSDSEEEIYGEPVQLNGRIISLTLDPCGYVGIWRLEVPTALQWFAETTRQ